MSKLTDILSNLKNVLSQARGDLAAKKAELAETKSRIKYLQKAPLNRQDTESRLKGVIDLCVADLHNDFTGGGSAGGFIKQLRCEYPTEAIRENPESWNPINDQSALGMPRVSGAAVLAAIGADHALRNLTTWIDRADFSDAGPPLSERKKELASLEKRQAELTALIADLEAQLAAAPSA